MFIEALRRLRITVLNELDARIAQELAMVSNSLDRLRASEADRQDAAARRAQLQASIAPLNTLATALTEAEEEVLNLITATDGATSQRAAVGETP